MLTELNLDNLKEIRQTLTHTIKVLSEEAGKASDADKISFEQHQQAKDEWGKLETKAIKLQGLIDKLELDYILNTDAHSSYSQIMNATNHLKEAAKKIDNFGNVLSEIAKVIDIFNSIIEAIETGGLLSFRN